MLRCDRGTNFVGAMNEFASLEDNRIQQELSKDSCDWVTFKMNFPKSSHMGGVWERMIRSARSVLTALLIQRPCTLDDELLRTLMAEVEATVNSRPLTYVDMSSVDISEPLTPNQLLTLKSKVVLPPPGKFIKEDLYCRKRWRRVQYLANQFWTKWRSEVLPTLQERRKWQYTEPNITTGDIVLVSDETTVRSQWPMAIVEETVPSTDGRVRKIKVRTQDTTLERPIHKVVLIYHPSSE